MALIPISQPDIKDLPKTFLNNNSVVSAATLTVKNGLAFSAHDFLLLETYEASNAEIVKISSTTPTSTTLNLDGSYLPSFPHGVNVKVTKVFYNKVAIEYSENLETLWESNAYATLEDASAAATWTSLTTIDLQPSQKYTVYNDTSTNRRSYRSRYYNSYLIVYSNYSSPILPDGYEEYSFGQIVSKALDDTNQELSQEDNKLVTAEKLFKAGNDCQIDVGGRRERWSWRQYFAITMSEITPGTQKYKLPFAIDITETKKSIWNVKVNDDYNLQYVDKRDFDILMNNVHSSTLGASLSSATTTITLADTSNFSDSGSFVVFTGTTQDTILYTANNRTTNTLTLASTNGATTTHASGTIVWQGATFSEKITHYTVFGGYLYTYPIANTSLYKKNITGDIYKKVVPITSFQTYVEFPDPLAMEHYISMKIYRWLKDSANEEKHRQLFEQRVKLLLANEYSGQKQMLIPKTWSPSQYMRRPSTRNWNRTNDSLN